MNRQPFTAEQPDYFALAVAITRVHAITVLGIEPYPTEVERDMQRDNLAFCIQHPEVLESRVLDQDRTLSLPGAEISTETTNTNTNEPKQSN